MMVDAYAGATANVYARYRKYGDIIQYFMQNKYFLHKSRG